MESATVVVAPPASEPAAQQPAADSSQLPARTPGKQPFNFEDAFGPKAKPAAAKDESSQPEPEKPATPDADGGATPPRGSAQEQPKTGDAPDASKPGAAPAADPDGTKPSTRGQGANERHEADKAELRAMVDAAIKERDDATAEANRLKQEQASASAVYAESIGPDAEYERLTQLNNLGDTRDFTAEDYANLVKWTQTRMFRKPFEQDALSGAERYVKDQLGAFKAGVQAEVASAYDLPSIDRRVLDTEGHVGKMLRHAHEAGAKSASAPLLEKISQLEADLAVAATQASAAVRTPEPPGRSGGSAPRGKTWNPDAPWSKNFEAAFGGSSRR